MQAESLRHDRLVTSEQRKTYIAHPSCCTEIHVSTAERSPVSAARRLVETLVANDVTHVFCVPGESYLPVLDALVDFKDRIQVITCRHEAGASNMAVAYAKVTGKVG